MKWISAALILGAAIALSGPARADADDMKWVSKCLKDNADAKVSVDVVSKYCTCMNDKMDSNETKSISAWEKTHPTEMKACEKEAGWK